MLVKGLDPVVVISILEFILAVYSIALALNTENKVLKVVHIVFTIAWVVLALLNIFF